VDRIHWPSITP
jgi:hypothetical protein